MHGNLLTGPTAEDITDKEAVNTTAEGLAQVMEKARLSAEKIPLNMAITSFAGLRATEDDGDFVLGEAEDAEGFFNAAGIDSPGLSSAPAIGCFLAEQIAEKLEAKKKVNFHSSRKDIPCVAESTPEEIARLVAKDPAYGNVICRCEMVTEGEIINAIKRPLGARSLDGVKRRTARHGTLSVGLLLSQGNGDTYQGTADFLPGADKIRQRFLSAHRLHQGKSVTPV